MGIRFGVDHGRVSNRWGLAASLLILVLGSHAQAATPAATRRLQLVFTGANAFELFGFSVAGAGDMNGDGAADVIVGGYQYNSGVANAGRASVFFGGPSADATPDWSVNGIASGENLGWSVAGAGDVNGDGYSDVIVGVVGNDAAGTDAGRAYVYFGGASPNTVPDMTLAGLAAFDIFGSSVAGAGDVNGDGFDDVIVGAVRADAGGTDRGSAYVFFGGVAPDAVADLTLPGTANFDNLGVSVAGAGDVNADGYDDVIVGADIASGPAPQSGRAYVFFGGAAPNAVADVTLDGAATSDRFGNSVAGAGDVNGDGFADVIVGARDNDAGGAEAGRAYLYYGGAPPNAVADLLLTGAAAADNFGVSVAGAGDVNRDGFADLIVGAHRSDIGASDAGRAYVYYGGTTPDVVADLTASGEAAQNFFGISVASAGDINSDGFDDLIVGGHLNDIAATDAGRAYLYDCNRYFVTSPNGGETWNVGATQNVTWQGSEPADLWLSVDAGYTYQLLRPDVGGNASNILPLLVPHTPTKFALVKLTPADPQVLGQDESNLRFTIQSSVALLSFTATHGGSGADLSWNTDPGVGPEGLAGYRLYRTSGGGEERRVGPDLIAENRYHDSDAAPGSRYRLTAVNGLMEETELGAASMALVAPLSASPVPYRSGHLTITFAVDGVRGGGRGEALVELYDLSGRRVTTLAQGSFQAGHQSVRWNGRDEAGARVPNGVYFVRSRTAGLDHRLRVVVTQ
jgi:hypothetical protein